MSLEVLNSIDDSQIPVGKLISIIARGQSIYLNHHLEEFGINSTQLYLLFEISNRCNCNQEEISKRFNINKGSVARSVRKLEEMGLITREIDENNRRQNKLSLTDAGEDTLDKTIKILKTWEDEVIKEKGYVDKELLKKVLKEIAIKTIELNQGE
ncbi:hypothetical protein TL18_04855 [Methanobrevibacter sp. YE315]|uniref:MarR family winged helix-turn-helix transcriptional regulator n=1 Tax=Methanobrevibacter sp. YE315 TaxID=1609968 RepID=UPI000764F042|nr:MarR family transcriptional regulator [Methanobrevibacter sp. YE315]AMD17406.1 hypothetical protein TL18_04855 [Methanobrevibacter sp. YE315]